MMQKRTAADGMETLNLLGERNRKILRAVIENYKQKYGLCKFQEIQEFFDHDKPGEDVSNRILMETQKGKVIKKRISLQLKKSSFIPIEPYKAAVLPIKLMCQSKEKYKHNKQLSNSSVRKLPNSNNVVIEDLVDRITAMRCHELEESNVLDTDDNKIKNNSELISLREMNTALETQLQYQIQVNNELKTLLIAALGEDIETEMKNLTEDRLQLAKALLRSTNCLSSHRDSIEWLTGQCEVWRSKFLASSLMVDELSKLKVILESKQKIAENLFNSILDEYKIVFNGLQQIFENLNKCDSIKLQEQNILELIEHCQILSENCNVDNLHKATIKKSLTDSEINIKKFLANSDHFCEEHVNELYEALMNEFAKCKDTIQNQPMHHPSNCASCKGSVENV